MSRGHLFVVSGASGVGKSTVLAAVMAQRGDLQFSVSATTRDPRPGEIDGREYCFLPRRAFEEMIRNGEFLEYDEHMGNYYGTIARQVDEKLKVANVLLDVEPNGAFAVRRARRATLIFVMPPSMEALEARLCGRGDTSEEQIRLRLQRAQWEMAQSGAYDHVVVNDREDACAQQILHIIAQVADK